MKDRQVIYIYNMWFNPNGSEYGDICFDFFKDSSIGVLDEDGKYTMETYSGYIYEDGSSQIDVDIDDDSETIHIRELSFDNNRMEEFKMRAMRIALNELWNKYVRKNKEE